MGYEAAASDKEVIADWKKRLKTICKPCWELKYCPYGPLVEDFPLPPPTCASVEEHNAYLRKCLATGRLGDERRLDKNTSLSFKKQIRWSESQSYPDEIPALMDQAACKVFGHICPAFFVSEPLTETKDRRQHGRTIPRDVMIKVIRRDGQICQRCHEPVPDNEVEFDHIIPFSRGGTSTAENIRLLHRACNRGKSNSLQELLAPEPITHLFELRAEAKKRQQRKRRKST